MAYDMYQERILQHYRSPRHFGPLEGADRTGAEANPLCGDRITVQLKLDASGRRIESARFSGEGCAISMASASLLLEKLQGLPVADAEKLTRDDVVGLVAIPLSPVRVKCALTGFAALGRALHGPGAAETPPAAASERAGPA